MSLVVLNALQKSFGGQEILKATSLEINSGTHIGLVGRNGVGKTTLLRMIAGLERESGGHIVRMDGLSIGYLAQDPLYSPGRTLYEEVREGIASIDRMEKELRQLEEKLADPELKDNKAEYNGIIERYSVVHDRFDSHEGWRADSRVETVLDGLKIPHYDWERDVSTFSGGERNVIGLARLLIQDTDLMLLDEPGNHLDFEGLDWLEEVLKPAKSAFILVSHNRYLLDNVCTSIWEMERGVIERYTGNYSAYRVEKLTRMEKLESAAKRQEKEIERLRFQIRRLKSWANVYDSPKLARTAKSFERRIEKMEPVKRKREDTRGIGIAFDTTETKGDIALQVRNYTRVYSGYKTLFQDVSFMVHQGDCVALVGANGTGKTTLIKDVVKLGRWENETLRVGPSMKIGYFAQMAEPLETGNRLIEEMMRLSGLRRNEATALLHRFLFTRDDLEKTVSVLSGGEKARIQLAALMASGANFLMLDEPTNHLDIYSREAVEDALEEFPGTLFIVSHDRYFLDKMVSRVLYLKPPQIKPFEGNFSDFWYRLKEKRAADEKRIEKERHEAAEEEKAQKPKNIRRVRFDVKRFTYLENEIARLEKQRERLNEEIEVEINKGNRKREAAKRKRFDETVLALKPVYVEWFIMGDRKKSY